MSMTKQDDQQQHQENRVHQLQQKPEQQIPPHWISSWWSKNQRKPRRRRNVDMRKHYYYYVPYVLAVVTFCCCFFLYFWLFGYTATDFVHKSTISKYGDVVVGNRHDTSITNTTTNYATTTKIRLEDGSISTSTPSTSTESTSMLLFKNTTLVTAGNADDELNGNRDIDSDDVIINNIRNRNSFSYSNSSNSSLQASSHPRARYYLGRLYYCGWTSGMQARWMFPDYRYVGKWQPPVQTMPFQRPSSFLSQSSSAQPQSQKQQQHEHEMTMVERVIQSQPYTEQDLLVFGMHGPCAGESSYSLAKLMHYFPGKILFINGENFGSVAQHQHQKKQQQQQQNEGPTASSGSLSSSSISSRSKKNYDPYGRVFQIGPYPPRLQLRNTLQVYTGIYWSTKFFMSWKQNEKTKKEGRTQQTEKKYVSKNVTTTTTSASSLTSSPQSSSSPSSASSSSSYPWLWLVDPAQRRKNSGRMGSAVVYLTTNCVPFRQYAARRIHDVVGLPIHTGPKCQLPLPNNNNNTNKNASSSSSSSTPSSVMIIPDDLLSDRKTYHTNFEHLFYHYKYCLVMENDAIDGYITEKIIMGFLGGCLPIYYGTEEIFDIFNRESFVFYNVSGFHRRRQPQYQPQDLNQTEQQQQPVTTDEDALKLLQQLEYNSTLYDQMLSVPILRNGQETINKYFSILPDIGDGSLNAKIRSLLMMEDGDGDGRPRRFN